MNTRALSTALALLSVLFIAFAWWVFATSAGRMHWTIPLLCTLLPFVVAAATALVRFLLARQGERRLERALEAEGARQVHEAPSERREEVERLRREFEQAVSALKRSKLATGQGGAGAALYQLPWYAIIGPPACGKTTVLRNSGLKFPYLPGTGDRLKGVGGTRNCDWWLTNHAILLDTAGRWTLEEDDHDEWLTFLDLLKRHRRGSPLNGVIAAISIAGDDENSLAGASLETVQLLAAHMRERLDEVISRLGLSLPVYLLFTKCDLISGFVESFGELSSEERKQIWGFTAPLLAGPRRAPGPYFAEQFDLLRDTLEQHALARMGEQAGDQLVPTIYEFPAQLASLKQKLTLFVEELFDDSAYGETPLLRGAYFTSGTQESTPADLLIEELASALKVRPLLQEPVQAKKSYFLHDMLMRVVFEDQRLVCASRSELARQQKRRRWITGALFGGAAMLSLLPTLSCRESLQSLERTRTLLARTEPSSATSSRAPERAPELAALGEDLVRYQQGSALFTGRLGLDPRERIAPPLRRYYGEALKDAVVRPLWSRSNARLITLTQQFASVSRQAPGSTLDESLQQELRQALKLHLLLSAPREVCVPPAATQQEFVRTRLLELWQLESPVKGKAERTERDALLSTYLELTADAGDALAFGRDGRSVKLGREALGGGDEAGRLLSTMLEPYAGQQRALAELAGASTVLESQKGVPTAFTREAWLEIARSLDHPESFGAGDEDWLFGCGREHVGSVRAEQQRSAFERLYLKRFEEHWLSFLHATSARTPSNLPEAETMLAELAGRPGVLEGLFRRVKEQTSLPPLRAPLAELTDAAGAVAKALPKAADKIGGETLKASARALTAVAPAALPEYQRIERSFGEFAKFGVAAKEGGASALDQYRLQVESLLTALKSYRVDDTKLPELALATRTAIDNVELLLRGHAGSHGALLRQLLVAPLSGVASIVLRERALKVERLYCDLVYRPFREEMEGRYPMRADSSQTASLASFERFFQPSSGRVWAFQNEHLKEFVALEGSVYRFGGAEGVSARSLFREELLTFLNRAARVTDSFFPANSSTVRMPFRIRVRGAPGYRLTSFRVGNTTVRYDSGIESWVAVEWPSEQASSGATLTVVPYQGAGPRPLVMDGEWGLFRMFDPRLGGHVLERSARMITAGFKPKSDLHFIKIDFASDDPHSPLLFVPFGALPQNLLPLVPPDHITQAGEGC